MLQRVFVADLDLARLARAEERARSEATDGNGAAAEGNGAAGNGAGSEGPADGRAALDGQPDGSGP
jgi:hypothetical protein